MRCLLHVLRLMLSSPRKVREIGELLEEHRGNLVDSYMYGLYNGLLMAYCLMTDEEYEPLEVP